MIARDEMIPAILGAEGSVLAGIASRDEARARALATHLGERFAFGSYETMLASPEIDAVYVPVPTADHVEWAARAIEAGKHVLVEKPLALEAGDIEPLIWSAPLKSGPPGSRLLSLLILTRTSAQASWGFSGSSERIRELGRGQVSQARVRTVVVVVLPPGLDPGPHIGGPTHPVPR